jgi:predicted glycosyltransferase
MAKAVLMYYCSSDASTGSKLRSLQFARELSADFDVTIVIENLGLDSLEIPPNVACVTLPAFPVSPGSKDFNVSGPGEIRDLLIRRRNLLLETFARLKPRICLVESFPFGQHRLLAEVLPLVERARNGVYGDSLVVSLTNGILPDFRDGSEERVDRAGRILGRYFDVVLVRSDPVFARLEEFFQPENTIETPTYHVGFMDQGFQASPTPDNLVPKSLLVSAGDGRFGGRLFQAALEAHKTLWPVREVPLKIITGERLPDADWQLLLRDAADAPQVSISRNSGNFRREVSEAGWSISQCEYDVAVDVLATDTPSLFVPCTAGGNSDQLIRAKRLVYWGRGRLVPERLINGASLAAEINDLIGMTVRPTSFSLEGASTAASLIAEIVYNKRLPPAGGYRSSEHVHTH